MINKPIFKTGNAERTRCCGATRSGWRSIRKSNPIAVSGKRNKDRIKLKGPQHCQNSSVIPHTSRYLCLNVIADHHKYNNRVH